MNVLPHAKCALSVRTWRFFLFIRFKIARISESVTFDGAMPVAESTVLLYALTFCQNVDISVRMFTRKVFIDTIPNSFLSAFHDRTFDVGIFAHMKLDALTFQQIVCLEIFALIHFHPDGTTTSRL